MKLASRDAMALSIGIELVVSVLVGLFGGWWLDKKLHTAPWLMMLGVAYGLAAGVRSLVRFMKRAEAESEREANKPPPQDPTQKEN